MNTHDIEPQKYGGDKNDDYVTGWNDCWAAIEADRKRRGEPAFYVNARIFDPATGKIKTDVNGALTWSEKPAGNWQVPVYTAPQPAEPVRGEPVAKIDPNPPQLSIVWHDSPESVDRAMWEQSAIEAGLTYEELIEGSNVGETEDGEVFEFTHEQAIDGMHTQGCWGFVDTKTNTINAWAADDVDASTVLHMLAHEIGHVTGDPHDDDMQEEMRAEQFGRVAALAYRLWCEKKSDAPQPAEPVKVPSFVELTNLAIEYGVMAGPILQGRRHAQLNESERFDAFIHALLARYGQPAEPDVLPGEAVFGFAAWLTSLKTPVTFSECHGAAVGADLAAAYNTSQGFDQVREDYHKRLKPYPKDEPSQPAEPVEPKRPYAQGSALCEFGVIPMCDQGDDAPQPAEPIAMSLDDAIAHAAAIAADGSTPCQRQHLQLAAWLRELREFRCASKQPSEPLMPGAGEDIMVNALDDVYTLPLQPSGLTAGPRFVVHVPAQPAASAEPTGTKPQGASNA